RVGGSSSRVGGGWWGVERMCGGVGEISAAAHAGAVKHIAKAKDPRVPLVIAADLTATSKAAVARRHGSTGSNVGHFEIRPSPTNVAADVTPGPKIWQGGWRDVSWGGRSPGRISR